MGCRIEIELRRIRPAERVGEGRIGVRIAGVDLIGHGRCRHILINNHRACRRDHRRVIGIRHRNSELLDLVTGRGCCANRDIIHIIRTPIALVLEIGCRLPGDLTIGIDLEEIRIRSLKAVAD